MPREFAAKHKLIQDIKVIFEVAPKGQEILVLTGVGNRPKFREWRHDRICNAYAAGKMMRVQGGKLT